MRNVMAAINRYATFFLVRDGHILHFARKRNEMRLNVTAEEITTIDRLDKGDEQRVFGENSLTSSNEH